MEQERRVRCNHCMSIFGEEYIDVDALGPDSGETCPVCSKGDALMDMEPAPDLAAEVVRLKAEVAAIRKECADRAVECFFSTMAESGLSTGNDYAVLVISDKLRAAIEGGQPKPLPVEVLAVASQDKLHIDIGTRKPVRAKKRGQP